MIVNDEQRRAMEFIAVANVGGYQPTAREINQWRLHPEPKPLRKGKLLQAEVPAVPERRVRRPGTSPISQSMSAFLDKQSFASRAIMRHAMGPGWDKFLAANPLLGANNLLGTNALGSLSAALSGIYGEYETIPGKPGKPAVYAPDKPPEKFLAHLRRLGWIERDNRRRYRVTPLGHALLDADGIDAKNESSSVIVLAKGSELAYAKVMGTIGGCGEALVVDAYLTPEAMYDIFTNTNATRFLINHKFKPDRVSELSVLLRTALPNEDGVVRELRQADVHDRYLIGEDKVYSLTASFNGLGGKSSALMVEMPETPARAVREEHKEIWKDAKLLARSRSLDDLTREGEDPRSDRAIREEDGRFLHDGCDVRHRKRSAAENCTNGQ